MIGYVRLSLCALSALLLVLAGADMREPGSGIPMPFGLLAYAAALWVLAYGVGDLRPRTRSTGREQRGRSWYEDESGPAF